MLRSKKKNSPYVGDLFSDITETRYVPVQVDEPFPSTIVEEQKVVITDPALSEQLPSRDDYTFENLSASGVPMTEVSSSVLTPSDPGTINSAIESAVSTVETSNEE